MVIQTYDLKPAPTVFVIVLDVVQIFHYRMIYKPGVL